MKHWVIVGLVVVALLYVWHVYSGHGGFAGFKQGLGIG